MDSLEKHYSQRALELPNGILEALANAHAAAALTLSWIVGADGCTKELSEQMLCESKDELTDILFADDHLSLPPLKEGELQF